MPGESVSLGNVNRSSNIKFKAAKAAVQKGAQETGKAFVKNGFEAAVGAIPVIGPIAGPLLGLGLDFVEAMNAARKEYQSVLASETIQAVPKPLACQSESVPAFAAKAA